jgi:SAM-dependent methyltransferase
VAVAGGLVALAGFLIYEARDSYSGVLSLSRNFYGALSVRSHYQDGDDDTRWLYRTLAHGRIAHGSQYVAEERQLDPTGYYGEESGVGIAIIHLRSAGPQRVGVIGLGTGTIAAHGREGDTVRFYEINPAIERLARTWFTYLDATPAKSEVVLGDARLSLEREDGQHFDVLAVDAFSGDAIPVHLLTREAFETYLRHMKPDGVIAVHISNRYLDLRPVVLGAAEHFGLKIAVVDSEAHAARKIYACTWVLLTRNGDFLEREDVAAEIDEEELAGVEPLLWTDDYSNLFQIVK